MKLSWIDKAIIFLRNILKRFFEWLYFEKEFRIIKIYSPIHFLIDSKDGSRSNVFIIWDLLRIKRLLKRVIK